MSEDTWMHKSFGQLSPEERHLSAQNIVQTIECELKKAGFSSFEHFEESLRSFAMQLSESLKEWITQFQESHRLLKHPISILSQHGWYLSPFMTREESIEIANLLSTDHQVEADKKMMLFFKEHERKIEKSICTQFPDREKLIRLAFKAHRRREYELSIPVMIAQADGMCKQLIGTQLFAKNDGVPSTSRFAEQFASDAFLSSILEPLRQTNIVSANTRDLPSLVGVLNRHGILHGTILDYASQMNSYKAISLLQYVVYFVRDAAKGKTA